MTVAEGLAAAEEREGRGRGRGRSKPAKRARLAESPPADEAGDGQTLYVPSLHLSISRATL